MLVDNFVDRNPNDILVFGAKWSGGPETANQKKMVQAGDRNDSLFFAIGPAGGG